MSEQEAPTVRSANLSRYTVCLGSEGCTLVRESKRTLAFWNETSTVLLELFFSSPGPRVLSVQAFTDAIDCARLEYNCREARQITCILVICVHVCDS